MFKEIVHQSGTSTKEIKKIIVLKNVQLARKAITNEQKGGVGGYI
jgi:hypothetical protein